MPAGSKRPGFTPKQGQYLAFIYAYTRVLGRPPAEADIRRHFAVTPPTVHLMLLTLERAGALRTASISRPVFERSRFLIIQTTRKMRMRTNAAMVRVSSRWNGPNTGRWNVQPNSPLRSQSIWNST